MTFLKNNALLLTLAFAVVVAGVTLMVVSQKVYDTQKHVQILDQEILAKQWDIRALKAELAYLSRPDRLEQISSAIAGSGVAGGGPTSVSVAPVSYSIANDLPPGMSLLPPAKPVTDVSYQVKPTMNTKTEVEVAAPEEVEVVKTEISAASAKKEPGFDSLLDSLGGSR